MHDQTSLWALLKDDKEVDFENFYTNLCKWRVLRVLYFYVFEAESHEAHMA